MTSFIIHSSVIFSDFFVIFGAKDIHHSGNTTKTKGRLFAVLTSETYYSAATSVTETTAACFFTNVKSS